MGTKCFILAGLKTEQNTSYFKQYKVKSKYT